MLRGLRIVAENRVGVLRDLTKIIAEEGGNVHYAQSFPLRFGEHKGRALIYFEIENGNFERMVEKIKELEYIIEIEEE
ncbi:MAG: ACT domain-containing protein, partial [Archaeoglobaceae archaeon]|nr:ACT domain-containing protein [Archaeoglobaceae archaeon]